ncbi:MAG: chemotaxis protein CheX [Planctomycetes bacterium]|nr:chemotaxis protein CheX [Planctomycetota bacterium]
MTIPPGDIERVVGFVWETLAGCRVERIFSDPAPVLRGSRLASIIPLEGGVQGRLALECPLPLARRAASHMFGEPVHQVELDKVQDALAELTNVVAGNLKALLDEPCSLGFPVTRILDAEEASPRRRWRPTCSLAFRAGPDSFVVSFQGRMP